MRQAGAVRAASLTGDHFVGAARVNAPARRPGNLTRRPSPKSIPAGSDLCPNVPSALVQPRSPGLLRAFGRVALLLPVLQAAVQLLDPEAECLQTLGRLGRGVAAGVPAVDDVLGFAREVRGRGLVDVAPGQVDRAGQVLDGVASRDTGRRRPRGPACRRRCRRRGLPGGGRTRSCRSNGCGQWVRREWRCSRWERQSPPEPGAGPEPHGAPRRPAHQRQQALTVRLRMATRRFRGPAPTASAGFSVRVAALWRNSSERRQIPEPDSGPLRPILRLRFGYEAERGCGWAGCSAWAAVRRPWPLNPCYRWDIDATWRGADCTRSPSAGLSRAVPCARFPDSHESDIGQELRPCSGRSGVRLALERVGDGWIERGSAPHWGPSRRLGRVRAVSPCRMSSWREFGKNERRRADERRRATSAARPRAPPGPTSAAGPRRRAPGPAPGVGRAPYSSSRLGASQRAASSSDQPLRRA